jgi:hypothetical protein
VENDRLAEVGEKKWMKGVQEDRGTVKVFETAEKVWRGRRGRILKLSEL